MRGGGGGRRIHPEVQPNINMVTNLDGETGEPNEELRDNADDIDVSSEKPTAENASVNIDGFAQASDAASATDDGTYVYFSRATPGPLIILQISTKSIWPTKSIRSDQWLLRLRTGCATVRRADPKLSALPH